MSYFVNVNPVISQATYSATGGGTSQTFAIGDYKRGMLFVYTRGLAAASRFLPSFQVSPNAMAATGQRWVTLRSYATSIKATGLSILTLTMIGAKWARISYALQGTGHSANFAVWFSGQAID